MNKTKYMLLGALLLALGACNQEDSSSPLADSAQSEAENSELALLAQEFHTNVSNIQDMGTHYVVDGDILVDKLPNDAQSSLALGKGLVTAQKYYTKPVNYWLASNICLYVPTAMKTQMGSTYSALTAAVNKWNTLYTRKTAAVKFTVQNADATGCVEFQYLSGTDFTNICGTSAEACASYPNYRRAFGLDTYYGRQKVVLEANRWMNNFDATYRQSVVMHELTHTLGMMHPDESGGSSIPGTPANEINSVTQTYFNGTDFTTADTIAIKYMYPYNNGLYVAKGLHTVGTTSTEMNYLIGTGQTQLLQNVVSFQEQASPYRLAALTADGHLLVKETNQSGIWVDEHAGVASYQISGTRIAIVTTDGILKVKEGALGASWSAWSGFSKKIQLEGNRIAGIKTDGCLYVKEGAFDSPFLATGIEDCQVQDFYLDGNRIGILRNGVLKVKTGALTAIWSIPAFPSGVSSFSGLQLNGDNTFAYSATATGLWWKSSTMANYAGMAGQVAKFKVSGNRIVIVQTDGTIIGKDGMSSNWVTLGGGAVDLDIRGDRIDAILTDGSLSSKTGLHGIWQTMGRSVNALNSLPL
jgi:hypothetical protein